MASTITLAIDGATAKACNDYEGRRMLKVPERRRAIMRLVVVLTVVGVTTWVVVLIAGENKSSFSNKRVLADSKEAQAYFLPVPPGSFLGANPDGMIPNISCPCLGQPSLSWCHFIDFFYIECNQKTNYQPKRTMISQANSGSCADVRPQNITFACNNALDVSTCNSSLDTVYNFPDPKTYMQTSNLASPFQVYDHVSRNMLSNIYSNNLTIHEKLKSNNNTGIYNHSILVMSLIQSMVTQMFNCNTQSTDQEFWDRGNQCGWNLYPEVAKSFNDIFVFGMTIDYEVYSTRCKPKYCYIIVKDTFATRLLKAFGEVGGVASIILMGIQMFLWPVVAKICRFPRARTPQVGAAVQAGEAIGDLIP